MNYSKSQNTNESKVIEFKSKKKNISIIYAVVAVAIVALFVFQVVRINYEPVKTEPAQKKTISDNAVTQAFVVRDEYPISVNGSSSGGTLVPLVEDGKRVASGDNVAVVFGSDEAAKTYNEIRKLEKQISYYSSLQNKVGVQTADITPLDDRIYSCAQDYIVAINGGNVDSYESYEENLRDAITSRQLSTGVSIDPSVKLAELNTKLEQLKTQQIGYSTISAPHPGYYISTVDGYENAVDYKNIFNLSTADITALTNGSAQQGDTSQYMGKLVDGFNWYLVCVIDYDNAVKLKIGQNIKLEFTMTTAEPIKAEVMRIADTVDGKTAVIFRCNLMNTEYAGLRNEQIRITFDEYTGYQVKNSAIREVNGEKGVYVLSGNIVKFKKINILYSDNDYSICDNPENKSGYIELYDEIIVEGTDLYDGKILN